MMQTDRLGLPLLAAGQSQKEITHNEALALIDLVTQTVVESADVAMPPPHPEIGQCWAIAEGAHGVWTDREGAIAGWTSAGWLFLSPAAGWRAWVRDRNHMIRFDGTAWTDEAVRGDGIYIDGLRVLSARQSAIAAPSGGPVQDLEARDAVVAILSALRTHGLIDD